MWYGRTVAGTRICRIVSGGQTGVDRAALDAAIEVGLPHGGWCPKGRVAEDGRIPERYQLRETDTPIEAERTEKNVLDSDGTLILNASELSGGTELTVRLAEQHGKPFLILQIDRVDAGEAAAAIGHWLKKHHVAVLNVAGPRASKAPGIYEGALSVLRLGLRTRPSVR
ncbi:MAG: putative molybdenum carrier protein [Nitrospirae bacterium]|nr:putative molybdenum carrier protein [Nitrospirota bacterium]